MKLRFTLVSLIFFLCTLIMPTAALAEDASHLVHLPQTFRTGKITSISDMNFVMHATDGIDYAVLPADAKFLYQNGAIMNPSILQVNDTIKVRGMLSNISINAVQVYDQSVRLHTASYLGTVQTLGTNSFTMQNKRVGTQTISISSSTIFHMGTLPSTLANIAPDQIITVTGTWDRSNTTVMATKVMVKVSKINLRGTVVGKIDDKLIVNGSDGKNYTVTVTGAKITSQHNTIILPDDIQLNHELKISGNRLTGSDSIFATKIQDLTFTAK